MDDARLRDIIIDLYYIADLLKVADRVVRMPNCNDCGADDCEHKPKWGMPVRYNCPLWEPLKEDETS